MAFPTILTNYSISRSIQKCNKSGINKKTENSIKLHIVYRNDSFTEIKS